MVKRTNPHDYKSPKELLPTPPHANGLHFTILVGSFALALVAFLLVIWIVPAAFEAKTFTKLTGKPVTTWDAMWIDLRVIEPATKGNRD